PFAVSKSSEKTVVPGGGSGSPPPPPLSTNSSRFGEPVPAPLTTPVVASATIRSRTCCGVKLGFWDRISSATPAACGDAMEVPLMVLVAELLLNHAEVIDGPGPNTSRQVPKLENEARWSLIVVAPTVIAVGTRAGEKLQAFAL